MKSKLLLLIACLLLVSASCSSTDSGSEETRNQGGTASVTEAVTNAPVPEYSFRRDWDGEIVSILNYEDPFEMNSKITTDAANGDILNDTKYQCMLALEDKMGVTIEETNVSYDQYLSFARSALASAEDLYDFIYVNEQDMNALTSENYLMNLLEFENLQLMENWWLHEVNDLITIGDTLYCAEGYSNLLVVDTLNIMLFNEDLAQRLDLDAPYSLVKDGKWTLDKFAEYLKIGADLNLGVDAPDADNIWNYDQPGNGAACSGLLVGCGEHGFAIQDGQVVFSAGSERYYNVCQKISDIMLRNQSYMYYKEQFGVSTQFKIGRALFSYGEIVTTQQLRNQDFAFGVLPTPKYDETQERYYCRKSWPSAGVSIPQTVSDPEKSAAFADALNYLSYDILWPVYRGLVLEQKNLRNEESIEMLDIILRSGAPSISMIYSIGTDVIDRIGSNLMKGKTDAASIIASSTSKIEKALAKLNTQE